MISYVNQLIAVSLICNYSYLPEICLFASILLIFICFFYLQNEFSVQFDDLFKKAWEEDVIESVGDGLYAFHVDFLIYALLYMNCL